MLSLPIGCMIVLFPKVFVTIFGLGQWLGQWFGDIALLASSYYKGLGEPKMITMSWCGGVVDHAFIGSVLQRHCGNTLWAGIGVGESKVGWMDRVIGLHVNFIWPNLMDGHM
jgi:hypothetical protein